MSDKDRRKKDGHDTSKYRQAMREDVKERHEKASQEGGKIEGEDGGDEGARIMNFKPGAASDRRTHNRSVGGPGGQR